MKTITKKIIFFTTLLLSISSLSIAQITIDFSYTGEEGDYLFIEETYYNVDGTIFDSRYFVYFQP